MTLEEISIKLSIDKDRLLTRADGRIEWICDHGVGHTVYSPDGNNNYSYIHGCDGCCRLIKLPIE